MAVLIVIVRMLFITSSVVRWVRTVPALARPCTVCVVVFLMMEMAHMCIRALLLVTCAEQVKDLGGDVVISLLL